MDPEREFFWDEIKPDLTPLIDGVFLLLIFFMVTTIFARPISLEVELPAAAHPADVKARHVKLYLTAKGQLDLEGEKIDAAGLEEALRPYVGEGREIRMTILADRHTPHGHTLKAMEAAQRAGIHRVYLATKTRAPGEGSPP